MNFFEKLGFGGGKKEKNQVEEGVEKIKEEEKERVEELRKGETERVTGEAKQALEDWLKEELENKEKGESFKPEAENIDIKEVSEDVALLWKKVRGVLEKGEIINEEEYNSFKGQLDEVLANSESDKNVFSIIGDDMVRIEARGLVGGGDKGAAGEIEKPEEEEEEEERKEVA